MVKKYESRREERVEEVVSNKLSSGEVYELKEFLRMMPEVSY
jgi:hypothetical protein